MRRCKLDNSGMGLIELMVIIVVIGILVSVAMQSMTATVDDVRRVKTEREMETLAKAIVGDPLIMTGGKRSDFGYVGDVGAFPPNLDALKSNPGSYTTWDGPYIPAGFTQDPDGYKTDAWGTSYSYSGGLTITSSGGGETHTKKIADASADYLSNQFIGQIVDASDSLPGSTLMDSTVVTISTPDGAGGTSTTSSNPDANGYFTLSGLPVGQHALDIVFEPDVDTLSRYVTILPRHRNDTIVYKFASNHYGGGGGGSTSYSEIIRPSGNGSSSSLSSSGCSNHWECTDETTSDDDGTYVYGNSNSSYRNDTYAATDHTGSGTVDSVVVHMFVKRSSSGSQLARTLIRSGGSDFTGTSYNLNGVTSYTDYSTTYTTNPATAAAWTWTEIDDLEIGVSIRKAGRCTQVWAEVFYTN